MLPNEYISFLNNRIKHKGYQSLVETVAIYALKEYYSKELFDSFSILCFGDNSFSQYNVEVDKSKSSTYSVSPRFCISSAESFKHHLEDFWKDNRYAEKKKKKGVFFSKNGRIEKFDVSFFNDFLSESFLPDLNEQIKCIKSNDSSIVFVFDELNSNGYSKDEALLFLLQLKFKKVIFVSADVVSDNKNNSVLGHVIIPSMAYNQRLLITPSITLKDLLLSNATTMPLIAVPMTNDVLYSEVINGVKWCDIIPNDMQADMMFDDLSIINFKINADIDGYQNIYLNIYSLFNDKSPVWRGIIYNSLGGECNSFPSESLISSFVEG